MGWGGGRHFDVHAHPVGVGGTRGLGGEGGGGKLRRSRHAGGWIGRGGVGQLRRSRAPTHAGVWMVSVGGRVVWGEGR